MSQPVKLSDALVLDARQTSAVAERSIAGQIEFWARLGRAVEPLLSGDQSLALRRTGDEQPLSALVASVGTKQGRRRVADYLASQQFPHYEPAEGRPGHLVRIEENGKRTVGKFRRGAFCPARAARAARATRGTAAKAPGRKRRPQP
ncbi:MAG: hypothetical protein WD971_06475 [Pirellulales bacterium]